MTEKEKQAMMAEIMGVVEKHVALSEKKEEKIDKSNPYSTNRYGRSFGISDEEMAEWKKLYRAMNCNTKEVLEQVRRNPIDSSSLNCTFDIDHQRKLL